MIQSIARNTKSIPYYLFGRGTVNRLEELLSPLRKTGSFAVFFLDIYFRESELKANLPLEKDDLVFIVDSSVEPTTDDIDNFVSKIRESRQGNPDCVISLGGGCTLDTGKAVANMLTNPGKAEDYQGWDLVRVAGIPKIGIPTLSGTGAEASRTCVMTNKKKNLKLGMNSDFTIYDQLILDPDLSTTVPRLQYFYSGMDTYIHCMESLAGSFRHPVADAFSREAMQLCREIFGSEDMMSDVNREKMMVASYLGGTSIANTFVGVVHPISAGLSIVLGTHHCEANCIAFNALEEFYPEEHREYLSFMEKQGIELPSGMTAGIDEAGFERLYASSVIHEKPLTNALGENFRDILTYEKVKELFKRM